MKVKIEIKLRFFAKDDVRLSISLVTIFGTSIEYYDDSLFILHEGHLVSMMRFKDVSITYENKVA